MGSCFVIRPTRHRSTWLMVIILTISSSREYKNEFLSHLISFFDTILIENERFQALFSKSSSFLQAPRFHATPFLNEGDFFYFYFCFVLGAANDGAVLHVTIVAYLRDFSC